MGRTFEGKPRRNLQRWKLPPSCFGRLRDFVFCFRSFPISPFCPFSASGNVFCLRWCASPFNGPVDGRPCNKARVAHRQTQHFVCFFPVPFPLCNVGTATLTTRYPQRVRTTAKNSTVKTGDRRPWLYTIQRVRVAPADCTV